MFAKHLFPVTPPSISKTDAYLDTITKKRNDFEAWLKKTNDALTQYKTTIDQMPVGGSPAAIYEKHVIVYRLIIQLRDNISSHCPPLRHGVSGALNVSESLTKAEISSRLNIVRVLSLSNDMAEIIYHVIDKNSSMTESEFTTKVEQLARKAHYLPGYGNDLLIQISTELGRLAIAYICLSAYLFLYAALSHAALIAATAFLGIAVILLGVCIGLRYLNQKTDIVDNLLCIIGHLKYNDLKFDGEGFGANDSHNAQTMLMQAPDVCRYTASGHFTDSTYDRINELLDEFLLDSNLGARGSSVGWQSLCGESQVISEEVSDASSHLNEEQVVSEVSSTNSSADEKEYVVLKRGDSDEYEFVNSRVGGCNYSPDFFYSPSSGSPVSIPLVNPDTENEFVGGTGPGR